MNGLTGTETGHKDRIVEMFSQAHNLAIGGNYAQALELYDRIIEDVPSLMSKTPQINYERALCLKALGQIDRAEQLIKSCLRIKADNLPAQELLANIQSERHRIYSEQMRREIAGNDSSDKTPDFAHLSMQLDSRDIDKSHKQESSLPYVKEKKMNVAKYCPETCIVFVSYGRPEIAARSYNSLVSAIGPYRDQVRIIISDATDDEQKMMWARSTNADDVILTPRFTPAATSRNLATTLILNKYTPRYLCMVEDDFEYDAEWYPSLVKAATRLYGVMSPFDLAYGIFSACDHQIPPERRREDDRNNVTAYIFGAVAYQRFVSTSHYLAVMRGWDADLLGISYAQTGGQTFRNVMRGFCGAILHGRLSWPIDVDKSLSTWQAKRAPGPPAHSFNLRDYDVIAEKTREAGVYQRDEK